MCFSATASFTAAAALGVVGSYSVLRKSPPGTLLFRAIPLVFAAHQFVEGMIWLQWAANTSPLLDTWLTRLWLLVALAVWPAWMPLSCALMEQRPSRRAPLIALSVIGTVFGAWVFSHALVDHAGSCVVRGHFYHAVRFAASIEPALHAMYGICTVAPLLLSTSPGTKGFAAALGITGVATAIVFQTTTISVWCFFAAWLSVLVVRAPLQSLAPAPKTPPAVLR